MLSSQRHRHILDRLAQQGELEVAQLARDFGCSDKTIRRDLEVLEAAGRLQRVHGGALRLDPHHLDMGGIVPVADRLGERGAEKRRIGKRLVEEIPEGATIFLGGGSTCVAAAAALAGRPAVTVITVMLGVAQNLAGTHHQVFLAGGEIMAATGTVRGPETQMFLSSRVYDIAILGTSALNARHGLMGPTPWHVAVTQLLLDRSDTLFVAADASKFDRNDAYRLCDLSRIDAVITDAAPPSGLVSPLRAADVRVIVAS